jgi:hypothetical protein
MVLAAGPTVATTEVEDVDGGPPGGCWQDFRQCPPPKLETPMVGPLGAVAELVVRERPLGVL